MNNEINQSDHIPDIRKMVEFIPDHNGVVHIIDHDRGDLTPEQEYQRMCQSDLRNAEAGR